MRVAGLARQTPESRTLARRVRQGVAALSTFPNAAVDRRLRTLLGDERQWALLARLSTFDRAHHLAVYDALVADGCRDPDILRAALLHDVGKADGRQRVRLPHRVVKVVGERWQSRRVIRLARRDAGWLRHGLWLAIHHPLVGSGQVAAAGASRRVCDLIRWHEDAERASRDAGLALLQRADDGAIR